MIENKIRFTLVGKGKFCRFEIWKNRKVGWQLVDVFEPIWCWGELSIILHLIVEELEDEEDKKEVEKDVNLFIQNARENIHNFPETYDDMNVEAKEERTIYNASKKQNRN